MKLPAPVYDLIDAIGVSLFVYGTRYKNDLAFLELLRVRPIDLGRSHAGYRYYDLYTGTLYGLRAGRDAHNKVLV